MSRLLKLVAGGLLLAVAGTAAAEDGKYDLGTPLKPEEIARWDIDVRPDGVGLPPGRGTAEEGDTIFQEKCAACHGEFGEGAGRWPVLMGGTGTLTSQNPVKTPGSYWPYASTLYDYIFRAMPFGDAQSLTPDEVYALTAFILNASEVIPYDFVLDQETLPKVEMPNRDGFIDDPRPDVKSAGEPCMTNCVQEVRITGRATQIGVTPERTGD